MYWLPFGEILTNMEREGFTVDSVHANSIKEKAINDMKKYEIEFKQWVQTT
jgi:DNA polymerase I-like protein with 3'-5' exonuclease and polymerase domains